MTRAEIQENIRYNERLVTQYQNQVNKLQNKVGSLESQIRSMNLRKSGYISNTNKLKRQIEELNQLKRKYQTLQTNFSNHQSKRLKIFNANFSHSFNAKFISSYISGMKSLLSGSEYKKAYNGLTIAKEKITKEIGTLQRQVDDLLRKVSDLQKEIDYKQRSISLYRSQKNSVNSNLAYRRKRIVYWKNQLRYAAN